MQCCRRPSTDRHLHPDNSFHLAGGAPMDSLRGGPMIGALAVNPHTTSILLAGVRGLGTAIRSGIYCSADSGVTWTPVFGFQVSSVRMSFHE